MVRRPLRDLHVLAGWVADEDGVGTRRERCFEIRVRPNAERRPDVRAVVSRECIGDDVLQ